MRKVASLVAAVVASFALAGAASATLSAAVVGPNTPGTNTYSIVMSFATSDFGGINGLISSLTTTGTYTGVFTDPILANFPANFGGPIDTPDNGETGQVGSWGHGAGSNQPGGSYTVATVEITVGVGDTISPFFTPNDGFVTASFSTVQPSPANVTGITIIPEPTTAALLGLGIVGLVVAGRRGRA